MLGRLFPKQLDNDYRGSVLAIWLLVPLALVKTLQGASVAGRSRSILETVDRVPLSSFPPEAALINWAFLAAAVVGFLLSVWPSKQTA